MADSLDEEYDPQPSIYKNTDILQSSGAQTTEAQRRPGRESPDFLRESASEDETEAQPQKAFRQTAGLKDRSRTELRSSNRRRTAPGGNRFSLFKNAERAHHQRSVYGNSGDTGLRKAAWEDSRQLDRNTMLDISYTDNSDTERRISEAPRKGTIKPKKPAPKHNKPRTWRDGSVIDGKPTQGAWCVDELGWLGTEKKRTDTPSTSSIPASPGPVVNPLGDNARPLENEPDYTICKQCKRNVLKTSIIRHLIACSKQKREEAQKKKHKRPHQLEDFLPSSSNSDDNDDSAAESVFGASESSDGEVSPVREISSTRFPGITTLHGGYGAPNSPNETLSETSSLCLRFSSITNYTISKDKTQGEEACNSELLAAFGQKIQAHCFGRIPQESPDLEDSDEENQIRDVAVGEFNFQKPMSKPEKDASQRKLRTSPSFYAPPAVGIAVAMYISGLPDGITADGVRHFASRSNRRVLSATYYTSRRKGVVLFETYTDLRAAIERLNGSEFRGTRVTCSEFGWLVASVARQWPYLK
jgi:hypothetical protein